MILLCILAALAGFAALSMGMSRHQRDVLGKPLPRKTTRGLKVSGGVSLACAWAFATAGEGAAIGSVYWLGALTFAALVVVFSVTRLSR